MCWKTAQPILLALLLILLSSHTSEAAYSAAVVRIDAGNPDTPFYDAGDNLWSIDASNNGGEFCTVTSRGCHCSHQLYIDAPAHVFQTVGASHCTQ